jgi:hypothetical protein
LGGHPLPPHGWLILEAGAVSYGEATPYLPVVTLLRGYLQIGDRDEPRAIREKVTGKLLTLDRMRVYLAQAEAVLAGPT